MPRDKKAAIEKPEAGDRWSDGEVVRSVRNNPVIPGVDFKETRIASGAFWFRNFKLKRFQSWCQRAEYLGNFKGGCDGNE